MVYVKFVPAVTVAGPVLVTPRSAAAINTVVATAELLAGLGSGVALETFAVLVKVVPLASEGSACTVMKMTSAWPAASVGMEQLTVPPPPGAGSPQAVGGSPGANVRFWKLTPDGSAS